MSRHTYTFSDGLQIHIELKRSAKKNLILRPIDTRTISINVPPFFGNPALAKWLAGNEPLLKRTLDKAASLPQTANTLPEWIWYQGIRTALSVHSGSHIRNGPSEILLPEKEPAAQLAHLRRFLHERAREYLLPRLEQHARATALIPTAAALTNAKTFWGVCRRTTGIRLNWRLIGAPGYVADYICIHELCHLPHPDHSPRFWAAVNRLAPHTRAAQNWLKTHGRELFVLG